MLTVLHRGPDGSERTFEAYQVTRFQPEGEVCCPARGEVRAILAESDLPGEATTLDISGPFGAVFVMNRHGATVARYMHD